MATCLAHSSVMYRESMNKITEWTAVGVLMLKGSRSLMSRLPTGIPITSAAHTAGGA